jgi:hypothetical protein
MRIAIFPNPGRARNTLANLGGKALKIGWCETKSRFLTGLAPGEE